MPKPRGADPTMSNARVNGDKTSFIGKSKMSISCWPYRVVKFRY
uniref:Uncharacterized protein n=1 Tax=Rhizophora mucronata TaxID=61149 RepID=A0A2P2KZJ7_RHIMU